MTHFYINVFTGGFVDEQNAFSYVRWSYDDDPDTPTSPFSKDFDGLRYDEDFVETIWGGTRMEYLKTLLVNESDAEMVEKNARAGDNTLVLIMEFESNRDIQIPSKVNAGVRYCGRFQGCFRDE
jgi:Immunity protein 22